MFSAIGMDDFMNFMYDWEFSNARFCEVGPGLGVGKPGCH
jgi:hypothetical protein